jgi:DNA ligase D-like protein (predicted ligase)
LTLFQERPIRPMMAKEGKPFDSPSHLFEPKWDGLRAILFLQKKTVEFQNRNLRDVTASYPELQNLSGMIKASRAIMDGEIVVLNEKGVPEFGRLQFRFGQTDPRKIALLQHTNPTTYVAFDLLHLDGKDLIQEPLKERKQMLRKIVTEGPHFLYADHIENQGSAFYSETRKLGIEGIIGKDLTSPYLPGVRSSSWTKIKGSRFVDAVIVGYSGGEGARTPTFGSLIVAMYNKEGKLVHVGNVGGGFDNQTLGEIKRMLDNLLTKTPTIKGPVDAPSPVTWVKPRLVCEVEYGQFTRDRMLRFPRFHRMRPDKKPEDCLLDEDIISKQQNKLTPIEDS